VTVRLATAVAVAAVLTLGACGTTYIDASKTAPPSLDDTTTTLPTVPEDTPLPNLLDDIETLMEHLDEQIVDDEQVPGTIARIDDLWVVAEQKINLGPDSSVTVPVTIKPGFYNAGTPISALGDVLCIAKSFHKDIPCPTDAV